MENDRTADCISTPLIQEERDNLASPCSSCQKCGTTRVSTDNGTSVCVTCKSATAKKRSGCGSTSVLPPCQVCGAKSSGYHYGANTCEACKAFFRRKLKRPDTTYPCICVEEAGDVGVMERDGNHGQKSLCPGCRYKKCLEAGMSKDAVKIGRYTLSWKSKNIQEVKKMRKSGKSSNKPVEHEASKASPLSATIPTAVTGEISSGDTEGTEPFSSVTCSLPVGSTSPVSDTRAALESGSDQTRTLVLPKMGICTCETKCPVHSMFALSRPSLADLEPLEQVPEEEVNSIIDQLNRAQESLNTFANMSREDLHKEQKEYVEQYQLRKELFGDLANVSYQEFAEVYEQTGIDIDNRLTLLLDHISLMEQKIAEQVAFAKALPGFKKLPLADQATLIKFSRGEAAVLANEGNFNTELGVVSWRPGKQFHVDEMRKLIDSRFISSKLEVMHFLKSLRLSKEERLLLQGIVVLYSDRCVLEKRSLVEEHQSLLIACLRHVVRKAYNEPDNRLAVLFRLLVRLRHMNDWEGKILRQIVLDYPMMQSYAIVRELII